MEKEEFLGKEEKSGGGVRNGMAEAFNVFPEATSRIAAGEQ